MNVKDWEKYYNSLEKQSEVGSEVCEVRDKIERAVLKKMLKESNMAIRIALAKFYRRLKNGQYDDDIRSDLGWK